MWMNKPVRPVTPERRWTTVNLILTFTVITLGALTRLLDAGLGCPDWPGCYGQFLPASGGFSENAEQWPAFPYDNVRAMAEMIHRYAASLLGLSILLFFLRVWKNGHRSDEVAYTAIAALIWVIIQGIFGALTVTLRIWPPVVTLHLLGGMIMLALCYRQFILTTPRPALALATPGFVSALTILQSLVFLQMAAGAWVSAHYAGLACPDLPLCQGQLWPDTVNGPFHAPRTDHQEYIGGVLPMADRMAVHMIHRIGAVLVIIAAVSAVIQLIRQPIRELPMAHATLLIIFPVAVQVFIGVINVIWQLPLIAALLHNTGAAILWTALWHLRWSLYPVGRRVVYV